MDRLLVVASLANHSLIVFQGMCSIHSLIRLLDCLVAWLLVVYIDRGRHSTVLPKAAKSSTKSAGEYTLPQPMQATECPKCVAGSGNIAGHRGAHRTKAPLKAQPSRECIVWKGAVQCDVLHESESEEDQETSPTSSSSLCIAPSNTSARILTS